MEEQKDRAGYKDYFNLRAKEVNELQNLFRISISSKLSAGEEMALYKSRFDQYIHECNNLIVKFFKFQKMNYYAQMYDADENLPDISDQDSDDYHDDKVTMRRFVKINFTKTGEVNGFELRPKMAPIIFIQNKFSLLKVKRAVRACIFINRLLRDGMDNEFVLQKIFEDDGDKTSSAESIRNMFNKGTQTDSFDIE